jgi:hypothetical protein
VCDANRHRHTPCHLIAFSGSQLCAGTTGGATPQRLVPVFFLFWRWFARPACLVTASRNKTNKRNKRDNRRVHSPHRPQEFYSVRLLAAIESGCHSGTAPSARLSHTNNQAPPVTSDKPQTTSHRPTSDALPTLQLYSPPSAPLRPIASSSIHYFQLSTHFVSIRLIHSVLHPPWSLIQHSLARCRNQGERDRVATLPWATAGLERPDRTGLGYRWTW